MAILPDASASTTRNLPVALDVMGGDHGATIGVRGGVEAARLYGVPILLVGRRTAIESELKEHKTVGLSLEIVEADEEIGMHEHPTQALRQKPRASLKLAVDLVAEGRACAAYSAGNSGAVMAAALFALKRLPGIDRPALGLPLPSKNGVTFLVDMGANTDCKAAYLLQFAAMGAAYMRLAFGLSNPTIGLLSNGGETEKGTALVREAHTLLAESGLNFTGNVEGNDLPEGAVDIVVTDGFTGNVLLKGCEGAVSVIIEMLRTQLGSSLRARLGAALAMPVLRALGHRLDFQEYGGAPVLGVNGVVLVGHGRSGARAVRNGVRLARDLAARDLASAIARELETLVAVGS